MSTQADPSVERKPLLDLSTLAPTRPTMLVDGEPVEFRLLEHDFSVAEHAAFQRDLTEFDELQSKAGRRECRETGLEAEDGKCPEHGKDTCLREIKLTGAEVKRLTALLDRLFDRVLLKPPEGLRDRLAEEQKRLVVQAFQYAPALLAARRALEEAQEAEERPSTSGS